MVKKAASARRVKNHVGPLDVDQAFIALLIGAMDASGHVSPEEGARAHNIIWSMRRYRRKSGETVGRLIEEMRTLIVRHGATPVIDVAARAVPAPFRQAAFAVAADLILVDGKMEPSERRFLERLGASLRLPEDSVRRILDVILIKNSA